MPFRSRGTRGVFFWRRLGFISLVFILSTVLTNHYARHNKDAGETHHLGSRRNEPRLYDDIAPPGGEHGRIRKLLFDVTSPEMDYLSDNDSVYEEELNCTPSTIEEFPKDVFTNQQRSKGAIILHTIFAVYMFLALAIVCDDYFVSSLEKICERLGFSEDVAGATFMAAGSSAPELFTSVIGVFIAKGDVGVGTIVGSAVFNILVIVGICGLFAGQVISLTWWPLFRDTLVYSISVITLVAVIYDGKVVWWEALIMLLMYGGYIFLMWLNPKIYLRMEKVTEKRRKRKQEAACNNSKTAIQLEQVTPLNADEATSNGEKKDVPMVDEYICNSPKRLTFPDAGLRLMLTKQFPARTRLRTACWLIITEQKQMMAAEAAQYPSTYSHPVPEGEKNGAVPRSDSICQDESVEVTVDKERAEDDVLSEHKFRLGDPDPLFAIPDTCGGVVKWIVSLPISIMLFFTIPDCRRRRFERWYMATFFMSIIWIMIFSYLMVWMVAIIGYTLHIPDTIMGITFLAAGTSVPDAIASLLVAREGLGDMAVSNGIGSNVFDILLGLALPWFMKTTIVDYGSVIIINSRGLLYSVILLFASVAATILAIHFNKWKLNKQLGILLCLFYLVFLSFSIMVELNVFGYVNPPVCKH